MNHLAKKERRIGRTSAAIAVALVLMLSPAVAHADASLLSAATGSNDVAAPDEVVEEVAEQIQTSGSPEEIAAFDALSDSEKEKLALILTSDDPLNDPAVTTVVEEKITASSPRANAARASTLVSSQHSVKHMFAGVQLGYFLQISQYNVSGGTVTSAASCKGTFNGFSGFLSISASDEKYVASGKAFCKTDFTGYLVYKGSSVQLHKEMGIVTSATAIVQRWLKNR